MPSRVVTLDQYIGDVGKLPDELEAACLRGLRSTAARGVSVVVAEIEAVKAVNTGQLRQSVSYGPLVDGAEIKVDAPHAPFIEHGTRPHMPPGKPIFEWVMRKGLAATEADAVQMTRAIQMKIAKNGTKPRRFFAKAMKRIVRDVLPIEVSREVNKVT